jgi:signal peptidase I
VSDTDKRQMPVWQESLLLVVTALVMAIIVKAFFVQAFYIPSESMEPGLLVNDKILVQKASYWFGGPERGDVVVFDDPGGWLDESSAVTATNPVQKALELVGLFPTGGHLIKRVIGVGGDHIVCCDTRGRLTINGTAIDEPYTLATPGATSEQEFDVKVPAGHIWVMGDNRGNSADSRVHLGDPGGGFVDVHQVVGKSWLRVWPLDRIGFTHDPNVFDNIEP